MDRRGMVIRAAVGGGVALVVAGSIALLLHGSAPADASSHLAPTSATAPSAAVSGSPLRSSAAPADATTASSAPLPAGRDTLVLGDSLGLDVYPWLADLLPDRYVSYDAVVGRAAPAALASLRARTDIPPVVLVSLGTNDLDAGSFRTAAEGILTALGPDRCVMWSDVVRPDSVGGGAMPINDVIEDLARTHTNLRVFRWSALVADHPGWLSRDGIHPGQEGAQARAQAFADAALACSPLDASAPTASKQYLPASTFDAPGGGGPGQQGQAGTKSSPSSTGTRGSSQSTTTADPTATAAKSATASGSPSATTHTTASSHAPSQPPVPSSPPSAPAPVSSG